MKSTTWLIGLALSVLSVVLLVKQAFTVGFVSALQIVLDFYEATMTVLLGWVTPMLDALLRPWGVVILGHWKHVFLLMWIFLMHGAGNPFGLGINRVNLFLVPWAFMVAFGASIAAAAIPLHSGDPQANFFLAAGPILAVALYWIGGNIYSAIVWPEESSGATWRRVFRHERDHLWYVAVAVVLAAVAMQVPAIGNAPGSGMAVLAFLMVIYAGWLIRLAAHEARFLQTADTTWWAALMTLDRARIGFGILGAFGGAALFVLTNAGLKLAGL